MFFKSGMSHPVACDKRVGRAEGRHVSPKGRSGTRRTVPDLSRRLFSPIAPYTFREQPDGIPFRPADGVPSPVFSRELFRVSGQPGIISFAGGLPGTEHIDVEGLARASRDVMEEEGGSALQYSTTDGYLPLRQYIADRYRRRLGIPARADEIQIVNGSQQCLDLVAKILVDPGDAVGMERPGYLGAIEAFSLYEPVIHTVPLTDPGPDLDLFSDLLARQSLRFFYGIPNSQNPSGRTYTEEYRKGIADLLEGKDTLFYEDDAFGDSSLTENPGSRSNGSSRSRVSCRAPFPKSLPQG